MSRAEDYRRYAAECVRLAASREDVNDKALLLHMAEQWRQLAQRADKQQSEQRAGNGS